MKTLHTVTYTIMTKKEARAHNRNWSQAVADGRVVAIGDGSTMTAYPTIAMRDNAIANLERGGVPYRIVRPVVD